MNIRDANLGDALDIAKIQVNCWKDAYKEIFQNEYLQILSYNERARINETWLRNLEETTRFFVAEGVKSRVIGFSVSGLERESQPQFGGELWGIYVSPDHQREGIGTDLVKKAIQHLLNLNINSMIVWILKKNPYRSFYEKLEGKLLEEREKDFQGIIRTIVSYGWFDIENLFSEL